MLLLGLFCCEGWFLVSGKMVDTNKHASKVHFRAGCAVPEPSKVSFQNRKVLAAADVSSLIIVAHFHCNQNQTKEAEARPWRALMMLLFLEPRASPAPLLWSTWHKPMRENLCPGPLRAATRIAFKCVPTKITNRHSNKQPATSSTIVFVSFFCLFFFLFFLFELKTMAASSSAPLPWTGREGARCYQDWKQCCEECGCHCCRCS